MNKKSNPLDLYSNFSKIILGIKLFAGLALIFIGVVTALVLIYIIYNIFIHSAQIQLFNDLISSSKNLFVLYATDKEILYFSEKIIGYIVIFILLSISSGLSVKISSLGFKIVDKLEFKYLMEKIWQEFQKSKTFVQKEEKISRLPGANKHIQ